MKAKKVAHQRTSQKTLAILCVLMQSRLCSFMPRRASPLLSAAAQFLHFSFPSTLSTLQTIQPTRPPSSSPFDSLWAVERLAKGKRFTARDRKEGRIPAYFFDNESPPDEHVLIVVDTYQIRSLWLKLGQERFLCTVFTLEVYDGLGSVRILYRESVLPRRLNFDKRGEICNIGFLRAPPGVKLRLDCPVRICGEENCLGLKKGGSLKMHCTYISVFCLPEQLPPYVEVKVDNMEIGDKIHIGDINIELPLHSKSEPSLPVCEIVSSDAK